MASDLASTPISGLRAQLCGDAHVSNFGMFASPERHLVFDINDFDETALGPWAWDVKRMAASVEIAGRDAGFSEKERHKAVLEGVRSYREAMRAFSRHARSGDRAAIAAYLGTSTAFDMPSRRSPRPTPTRTNVTTRH